MIQTLAIFHDSYRELNSKKLFWVTLALSGLVALSFLTVGIDAKGISVFGHYIGFEQVNSTSFSRSSFYRFLFVGWGIQLWLTTAATILGLISTTGFFPDFLSSGSVDLYLSKPIGRFRLFLTKYTAALLFVAIQLALFCLASIIVLRVRGGFWAPKIFLAVPICLAFYSYLFAVSVLVGVLTRSQIAALMLTLLFWFIVFGIHGVEIFTHKNELARDFEAARLQRNLDHPSFFHRPFDVIRTDLKTAEESRANWKVWYRNFHVAMAALPKTSETVELLPRYLFSKEELAEARPGGATNDDDPPPSPFGISTDDINANIALQKEALNRSLGWVIGTSLGFEAVVVGLAAWIFCRRDY